MVITNKIVVVGKCRKFSGGELQKEITVSRSYSGLRDTEASLLIKETEGGKGNRDQS